MIHNTVRHKKGYIMPSKKSSTRSNAPDGFESKMHGVGLKTYGVVGEKYRADLDLLAERTGDYKNAVGPAVTAFVVDNKELFSDFVDGYWVEAEAAAHANEVADILDRYPELTRR